MNYIDSFQADSDGMYKQSILYTPQQLITMLNDAEQEVQANLNDASACLKKANVLLSMRRFAEAQMHYERTIWLEPNVAFPYLALSIIYRKVSQYSAARTECDRAVQLAPKSSLAHIERAMILFEENLELAPKYRDPSSTFREQYRNDINEGLKIVEYALQLDPNNAMAYVARGNAERLLAPTAVFSKGKHYQAAVAECDRAIKLDPLLREAYIAKTGALIDFEQFEGALSSANRLIEVAPYDGTGYYLKHAILQRLGRKEEASRTLQEGTFAVTIFDIFEPN